MVEKNKGSQFTIYAMTIHNQEMIIVFNKFTKNQMEYNCELMEAVTRNLRSNKFKLSLQV